MRGISRERRRWGCWSAWYHPKQWVSLAKMLSDNKADCLYCVPKLMPRLWDQYIKLWGLRDLACSSYKDSTHKTKIVSFRLPKWKAAMKILKANLYLSNMVEFRQPNRKAMGQSFARKREIAGAYSCPLLECCWAGRQNELRPVLLGEEGRPVRGGRIGECSLTRTIQDVLD